MLLSRRIDEENLSVESFSRRVLIIKRQYLRETRKVLLLEMLVEIWEVNSSHLEWMHREEINPLGVFHKIANYLQKSDLLPPFCPRFGGFVWLRGRIGHLREY